MEEDPVFNLYAAWRALICDKFCISGTLETRNFGTFGGVVTPSFFKNFIFTF